MNELYLHLRLLGIYPITMAAEWIGSFFLGFLKYEQILLLIDRILGFETLLLLPIMALGVFKFFSQELLECKSKEKALDLIYIEELKALELLNLFIFDNNDFSIEDEDEI